MPEVLVSYGEDVRTVVAGEGSLLGEAVMATGLPLEQPCAGRGTCGQCKVLVEGPLGPPDEAELKLLSPAEQAAGYRLACRARVQGDVSVTLSPIVVYSNKIFRASEEYRQEGVPLGLAIDLGTTTVAAFLTMLDSGRVCAGAAALNQQIVFGADVISRLAAAGRSEANAERLSALALASIGQAIAALKLPPRIMRRVRKATIVGNCAMHHLLLRYPVRSLSMLPFQPHSAAAVRHAERLLDGVFPPQTEIALPPLIGGFVGSDALACLAYFGFDRAPGPMAAIDLGTNGEVMVTDGKRILVASTAAGPAFEGVNISCGTRAVDGAIVAARAQADGSFAFTTIGDRPPVGLTGSGLLSLVCELRRVGVIEPGGRFVADHPLFASRLDEDARGVRRLRLTDQADEHPLYLTQQDVRELQKAKAAVRAAAEILMGELGLQPGDLQRLVLTGSFGSQVDIGAVVGLGMIPPVPLERVETEANGAGLGAALFLDEEEFARGERLAAQARQVDLDLAPDFRRRFIGAMAMPGEP
ncbi:MAG: ASKHA domain-containing protein [Anaerolineae bacterium]|nr:ASKHA domain-containing protein [Anaerolineae bacterium]